MANMVKRRGRCTNFGNNCATADANKIVEVDITEDFVCPDCGSDLMEIAKKELPKWLIPAVAAVVVIAGAIGLWLGLSGGSQPDSDPGLSPEIVLSRQYLSLTPGETAVVIAAVRPSELDGALVWKSADERIAQVADGVVTAVAEGETVVKVTGAGGKASADVSVKVSAAAETPREQAGKAPSGLVSGRFTGTLKDGYPHGTGTLTFTKGRRIDMHDEKERAAASGDYIIGEWDNGHLIQGRWYDAANNLKETIVLGKAMSPDKDHVLGRCSE